MKSQDRSVCSVFSSTLNYRYFYAIWLNWTDFYCWGLSHNTTNLLFHWSHIFFSVGLNLTLCRPVKMIGVISRWQKCSWASLSDGSSGDQVIPLTSCTDLYCGGSVLSNLFRFVDTVLKTHTLAVTFLFFTFLLLALTYDSEFSQGISS